MLVSRLSKKLAVALLSAALFAPSAASWSAEQLSQAKPVKVRFAYSLSTTTFPLLYGVEKGFFAKRGLDLDVTQFANFQAVYTAFRAGSTDMGSGGLASVVNLRGNGVPIKVVWGTSKMSNDILVPRNSSIKSPSELKGKVIGVFGGASGTTANMFMAIMKEDFGFDPRSAARVKYGASALLAGLMAKGDVAAFVSNDPITAIEMAAGRVVSLGELGAIYAKQHGGYHPHAGALTVSDGFAKEHPEAVSGFLGGWLEAIRALEGNRTIWQNLLKTHLKIDDPATADLLMKRVSELWPMEWTENNVQGEIDALKFINKAAGKGFLDKIPDDAFLGKVSPR